jgi:predicted Zn-dependent peptidase
MKENFRKKILKNGMTVLFEKREIPVMSMIFAVKSGGINESLDEKGISHFIEHMLYKGTKKRSAKKIAEDIEKTGGELNGFTSEELTGFWCKIPSKNLYSALDVLMDLVKNPVFDEKELEKERKVIFEEMKLYKDNPRLHVLNEIQKILYTGTLSVDLIGTQKTMNSLSKKKLVDKFKKIYTPENMIFCSVGNGDFKKLINILEKNFKSSRREISKQDFKKKNEIKYEKRKGLDQANLVFAFHSPISSNKDSYAAHLLLSLMVGGMSSRLFSEIREKRNLAYAVKGEFNCNKEFSYSYIYVGTTKENVEKVKELILREFEDVSKNLRKKEFDKIKKQVIGNYEISMEDSQTQMINLLASEFHNKAEDFYEFSKNIAKVKINDIKRLASLVSEKNYSFYALIPED